MITCDKLMERKGLMRVVMGGKVRRSRRQEQCSQRSGAPVGPGGETGKGPGRDVTAKVGPFSSGNPQDGRHR